MIIGSPPTSPSNSSLLNDAMTRVDIAASPPAAAEMMASPTICPANPAPTSAAFRAPRRTIASGSQRAFVASSTSTAVDPSPRPTSQGARSPGARPALVTRMPALRASEHACLAEQMMVANLDEAYLLGAQARAFTPTENIGGATGWAKTRSQLRATLHQAAFCASEAHEARVRAQPHIFCDSALTFFTLGHLCYAAIVELLLFDDDADPNVHPTLIDSSTLALLGQLRDLMHMPQAQRCALYGQSEEATRRRVIRMLFGAVMRNCPEPFIDEPIADTALGDWRRMRRWRHRYACDLVAGGAVAAPLHMPIAPNTEREVRSFFGEPWDKALAWLDSKTLTAGPST